VRGRAELETLGWDVDVLDGLDHMRAMQADEVLPIHRLAHPCDLAAPGTDSMSCRVYACFGCDRISSAGPLSTISP
jgi:hypothetical protein